MPDHVLIERAFRFPAQQPKDTEGWVYNREIGAWVDAEKPNQLMVEPGAGPDKPKPRPVSKKMDIETGEDMKGA